MTLGCDNVSVSELIINGVVHARRNYFWQQQISCAGCQNCVCTGPPGEYGWDSAHVWPNGWDNIFHKEWVDLPAGVNTIDTRGFRFGLGGAESMIEVAVWRKACPTPEPIVSNIVCIPASTISGQGLCEFERLAALYGVMVGCVQVVQPTNCTYGPDVYQDGPDCIQGCEGSCFIYADDVASPGNPFGGQPLNSITLNYAYETRVQITWTTAFLQNFFVKCDPACPDCPACPPP